MARSQMSETVISSNGRSDSSVISASQSNLWVRRTRKSVCSTGDFIDTPHLLVAYLTQWLFLLLDCWCLFNHTQYRYRSKDMRQFVDHYARARTYDWNRSLLR